MVPHDFVIGAPHAGIDVRVELQTDRRVVRFVPEKPGHYVYFCDKTTPLGETHREKGMVGVLEVVQP